MQAMIPATRAAAAFEDGQQVIEDRSGPSSLVQSSRFAVAVLQELFG
jgi:hypothetical protein